MINQMDTEESNDRPEDVEINAKERHLDMVPQPVTIWLWYSFAPQWYQDTLNEAHQDSRDARRREIVFAVCTVESYLFEWVRDSVFKKDFRMLEDYFQKPDREKLWKKSILKKWKEIIEQLYEDGCIQGMPDFEISKWWSEFNKVVKYRNGLVHGGSSRPNRSGLPDKGKPKPSITELNETGKGWPVKVVYSLISELHDAVGTDPPDWLKPPE